MQLRIGLELIKTPAEGVVTIGIGCALRLRDFAVFSPFSAQGEREVAHLAVKAHALIAATAGEIGARKFVVTQRERN
jgi:hypothetical protein